MEQLKPKSKDKAKPDLTKASILTPPAGHNGPSHDQILIFAGRLIEQRAKVKAEQKAEKRIRQQATNAGIVIQELNEAMEIADIGIDAVVARFQRLIEYTKALGAPIGEQLTLFVNPADKSNLSREDLLYAAFHKGRILGLMGQEPDSQSYPLNGDIGQEHLRGWNEGDEQRHLQEKLTENSEAAAAEEAAKKKAKKAKKDLATDATVKIIEGTVNKLDEEEELADA